MNRVMATLILLLPLASIAASPDIETRIRRAAHDANETYKANGLAGLAAQSRNCYKERPFDFYCVDFDVAAGYLDRSFSQAMGIKRYPYFDSAHFLSRARPIFGRARWSMETSNLYLQFVDSAVHGEIGRASGGG